MELLFGRISKVNLVEGGGLTHKYYIRTLFCLCTAASFKCTFASLDPTCLEEIVFSFLCHLSRVVTCCPRRCCHLPKSTAMRSGWSGATRPEAPGSHRRSTPTRPSRCSQSSHSTMQGRAVRKPVCHWSPRALIRLIVHNQMLCESIYLKKNVCLL